MPGITCFTVPHTSRMKLIRSTWEYIKHHEAIVLSFCIHLFILIIFIRTVYYVPKQKMEEPNAASILLKDKEGGKSKLLKYHDKSLVDRIKMKDEVIYPHPEITSFPVLPDIKLKQDLKIQEELNIIGVESMNRTFSTPLGNRQPLFSGKEGLSGPFAEYIQRMRRQGLDICFVFDSTASMDKFLEQVKIKISGLISSIKELVPAARIGLVTFRDTGMEYLTRAFRLSHGTRKLIQFLKTIEAKGGGDVEEAIDEGLRVAIQDLNWRKNSIKIILLIGDSPPHQEDIDKTSRLIKKFREEMGGMVATLDTNQPKFLRAQYYGCPPDAPIPCDYVANENIMEEFQLFAKVGGGQSVRLDNMEKMNRMIIMQIFGADWKEYLDVFLKNL